MPPGAPGWHLPTASEPMIWEGLNDRQLCELFKNPAHNGHRSVDGIVRHMKTPLVLWAWNPAKGALPFRCPRMSFWRRLKSGRRAARPVPAKLVHPKR